MFSSLGKPNLRKRLLGTAFIEEECRAKSEKKKKGFNCVIEQTVKLPIGKATKNTILSFSILLGFKI